MAGKQINELESTNIVTEGDLFLARKSNSGTDKKINYSDFVDSIGNPAIDGFTAIADPDDLNGIILTPANNAKIPRYFQGMKISFISPIKNTFNVKIKIGNLPSKDFLQYQSIQGVSLEINDYVEAVFITDTFYQINNFRSVSNIYSDEYTVLNVEIEPDQSFSTLILSSSIGLKKNTYYDGMCINFICPSDTKGGTKVTIDAIPNASQLIYDSPTKSLPLYGNQIVRAIYSSTKGGFIKDNFSTEDPEQKPVVNTEEVASNEDVEAGRMPKKKVEVANLKEYTIDQVTSGSYSYDNLKDCIDAILEAFPQGVDSSVEVTITINKSLDASNTLLTIDRDLSWITLRSINKSININKNGTKGYIFTQTGGKFLNFEKDTLITITNVDLAEAAAFLNCNGGDVLLSDLTIIGDNLCYCFSFSSKMNVQLTNCHLKNMRTSIYSVGAIIDLIGCTIKNWIIYGLQLYPSGNNSIINLTNCDLRKTTFSSIEDIITDTTTSLTKITVNQINTKARFSQNGAEIVPNSSTDRLAYNVSGGQN